MSDDELWTCVASMSPEGAVIGVVDGHVWTVGKFVVMSSYSGRGSGNGSVNSYNVCKGKALAANTAGDYVMHYALSDV